MHKLITLLFILTTHSLLAQNALDWQTFNETRLKKQKKAMIILGSWSVANMASGAILQSTTDGEEKYFHQMNLIWNTVNFALAGSSLLMTRNKDVSNMNAAASIKAQHDLQKILLVNAGIDFGYIMLGAWYVERGKNASDTKTMNRQKGYGKSIILQGSFLLLFDAITAAALSRDNKKIPGLLGGLTFTGNGIAFQKTF